MKRIIAILGLVVAVTAFAAVTTTYRSVQRLGPYYSSIMGYDTSLAGGAVGGEVRIYKNGTDTLIVGDVVYLSARNTVLKSATLANYNTIIGVVVGGQKTNMQAVVTKPASTDTAATSGQNVLVMSHGRTWIWADTTTAGIAPGTKVIPSLVAGKAKARTTAIDSFYRIFATVIDSGVRNTATLALISVK